MIFVVTDFHSFMKEAFGVFGASLMKAPKLVIFTKNPSSVFLSFFDVFIATYNTASDSS